MSDDPIDLTPLDPTADAPRFDRVVGAIVAGAAPELARRRAAAGLSLARAGVLGQLGRWHRPMLAAAALVMIVSLATVARVEPADPDADALAAQAAEQSELAAADSAAADSTGARLAEAIGVPGTLAAWVGEERIPAPEELIGTLPTTPGAAQ